MLYVQEYHIILSIVDGYGTALQIQLPSSLHDPDFQKMRRSGKIKDFLYAYFMKELHSDIWLYFDFVIVEQATFIFGSMFWGCFLSK